MPFHASRKHCRKNNSNELSFSNLIHLIHSSGVSVHSGTNEEQESSSGSLFVQNGCMSILTKARHAPIGKKQDEGSNSEEKVKIIVDTFFLPFLAW